MTNRIKGGYPSTDTSCVGDPGAASPQEHQVSEFYPSTTPHCQVSERRPLGVPLKGVYKGAYSTPPAAEVSTKNHHKTMIFEVPEAEILRTPIKIEKLSLWNTTWSEFTVIFLFHRFLEGLFFICFYVFYLNNC